MAAAWVTTSKIPGKMETFMGCLPFGNQKMNSLVSGAGQSAEGIERVAGEIGRTSRFGISACGKAPDKGS
jgi:hypothetical protein